MGEKPRPELKIKDLEFLPFPINTVVDKLAKGLISDDSALICLFLLRDCWEVTLSFINSIYLSYFSKMKDMKSIERANRALIGGLSRHFQRFTFGTSRHLLKHFTEHIKDYLITKPWDSLLINLSKAFEKNERIVASFNYFRNDYIGHGSTMPEIRYLSDLKKLVPQLESFLRDLHFLRNIEVLIKPERKGSGGDVQIVAGKETLSLFPFFRYTNDGFTMLSEIDTKEQCFRYQTYNGEDKKVISEGKNKEEYKRIRDLLEKISPNLFEDIEKRNAHFYLNFQKDIESLLEEFTPRPELENALLRQIEEGKRLILLSGGPGTGKTTLMARLAQLFPDTITYLFCRASSVSTAQESIYHQIIEKLEREGLLVPGENYFERSRLSDEYIRSVETLSSRLQERIIIIIDALDESFGDISSLVPGKNFVGSDNVTFVVSARTGTTAHSWTKGIRQISEVCIPTYGEIAEADLTRYVKERLLELDPSLNEEIVPDIVKKSEGNFLYCYYIVHEILKNGAVSTKLPSGLFDHYKSWSERTEFPLEQRSVLKYVMALLSVTSDPLPIDSIESILTLHNIPAHLILKAIEESRAYLKRVELDGTRFALYHKSFADFAKEEFREYRKDIYQWFSEAISNIEDARIDDSLKEDLIRNGAKYILDYSLDFYSSIRVIDLERVVKSLMDIYSGDTGLSFTKEEKITRFLHIMQALQTLLLLKHFLSRSERHKLLELITEVIEVLVSHISVASDIITKKISDCRTAEDLTRSLWSISKLSSDKGFEILKRLFAFQLSLLVIENGTEAFRTISSDPNWSVISSDDPDFSLSEDTASRFLPSVASIVSEIANVAVTSNKKQQKDDLLDQEATRQNRYQRLIQGLETLETLCGAKQPGLDSELVEHQLTDEKSVVDRIRLILPHIDWEKNVNWTLPKDSRQISVPAIFDKMGLRSGQFISLLDLVSVLWDSDNTQISYLLFERLLDNLWRFIESCRGSISIFRYSCFCSQSIRIHGDIELILNVPNGLPTAEAVKVLIDILVKQERTGALKRFMSELFEAFFLDLGCIAYYSSSDDEEENEIVLTNAHSLVPFMQLCKFLPLSDTSYFLEYFFNKALELEDSIALLRIATFFHEMENFAKTEGVFDKAMEILTSIYERAKGSKEVLEILSPIICGEVDLMNISSFSKLYIEMMESLGLLTYVNCTTILRAGRENEAFSRFLRIMNINNEDEVAFQSPFNVPNEGSEFLSNVRELDGSFDRLLIFSAKIPDNKKSIYFLMLSDTANEVDDFDVRIHSLKRSIDYSDRVLEPERFRLLEKVADRLIECGEISLLKRAIDELFRTARGLLYIENPNMACELLRAFSHTRDSTYLKLVDIVYPPTLWDLDFMTEVTRVFGKLEMYEETRRVINRSSVPPFYKSAALLANMGNKLSVKEIENTVKTMRESLEEACLVAPKLLYGALPYLDADFNIVLQNYYSEIMKGMLEQRNHFDHYSMRMIPTFIRLAVSAYRCDERATAASIAKIIDNIGMITYENYVGFGETQDEIIPYDYFFSDTYALLFLEQTWYNVIIKKSLQTALSIAVADLNLKELQLMLDAIIIPEFRAHSTLLVVESLCESKREEEAKAYLRKLIEDTKDVQDPCLHFRIAQTAAKLNLREFSLELVKKADNIDIQNIKESMLSLLPYYYSQYRVVEKARALHFLDLKADSYLLLKGLLSDPEPERRLIAISGFASLGYFEEALNLLKEEPDLVEAVGYSPEGNPPIEKNEEKAYSLAVLASMIVEHIEGGSEIMDSLVTLCFEILDMIPDEGEFMNLDNLGIITREDMISDMLSKVKDSPFLIKRVLEKTNDYIVELPFPKNLEFSLNITIEALKKISK